MGAAPSVPAAAVADEDVGPECAIFARLVELAGATAGARLLRCGSLGAWGWSATERVGFNEVVARWRDREQRRRWAGLRKGYDSVVPVRVSLEELFCGCSKRFTIARDVLEAGAPCERCAAMGVVAATGAPRGGGRRLWTPCGACGGRGHAERKHRERLKLDVAIDVGASDGRPLRFPSAGDEAPGRAPGDVVFRVVAKQHETFERLGADLVACRKLGLSKEANVPEPFSLRHLDGRYRTFKSPPIPADISPDVPILLCAPDEGMPLRGGDGAPRGKLFVRVHIAAETAKRAAADLVKRAVSEALDGDVVTLRLADPAEVAALDPANRRPTKNAAKAGTSKRGDPAVLVFPSAAKRRPSAAPALVPAVGLSEEEDVLRMLSAFPL